MTWHPCFDVGAVIKEQVHDLHLLGQVRVLALCHYNRGPENGHRPFVEARPLDIFCLRLLPQAACKSAPLSSKSLTSQADLAWTALTSGTAV